MRPIIYFIFIVWLCCMTKTVQSQQIILDNQYYVNPFSLSPAFAGFNGNTEAFLSYRRNWVGIPGAPQKANISMQMPIKEHSGAGLNIINQTSGNFQHFSALLCYAYHTELTSDIWLSFGIGLELYKNQIDLSKVKSQTNDPYLINQQMLTGTTFDATASFLCYVKGLIAGITVPRTIGMEAYYRKENEETFSLSRLYSVHLSYPIAVNSDITLSPMVKAITTQNSPVFYEVDATINFKKQIWGGATYRKDNAIGIHIGGALDHKFIMQYNYEFGIKGIASLSSGTHELTLGYLIRDNAKTPALTVFGKAIKIEKQDTTWKKSIQDLKDEIAKITTHSDSINENTENEINKLRERVAAIEEEMAKTEEVKYKEPYILENIKFGNNSDKLFSSSFPVIDRLAEKMRLYKKINIKIIGYTDDIGSPRYNLRLSKKRAIAVKNYLIATGISNDRIITDGMGEKNPIASNDTHEGRSKNQRIEIYETQTK